MTVNYNELYIEINFAALAQKHGVRRGTIFYSDTFNSWVIQGHPDVDLICIDPPFKIGDLVDNLKGKAARFNGKTVKHVSIKSDNWCFEF